ncbi:MAG TPA: hypothetical protein VF017_04235 [Thermoanaerobaculia bacterium]|nr:hypothetical protein [Thermoanaerobaculia bacterium]
MRVLDLTGRRLIALALSVLCLGAALEIHPASESVDHGGLLEHAASGSCHPGLADHFEPTPDQQRSFCPVCLLRVAAVGLETAPSRLGEAPVEAGRVLALIGLPAWAPEVATAPSRGPPAV